MSDPSAITPPKAIDATLTGYAKSVLTSVATSALMVGGAWLASKGIHVPTPDPGVAGAIAAALLAGGATVYKAVKSYLDHKVKIALAQAKPSEVDVKR